MGLDRELFTETVEDEFLCGLCRQVLLNPITAGCHHIFCQKCINTKFKYNTTFPSCPACKAELTMSTEDTSVEFKLRLLHLTIRCSHNCGETFELAELPDHMEICLNAPVECDFRAHGCDRTIKRRDKRKHSEECDFRPVECEACGHQTVYKELFTHQSRVRCLEKKLKQQIIRERKAASREINRHREKLFRENARLDQHQRKKLVSHAKSLTARKQGRNMSKDEHQDSDFEYTQEDAVFITENRIQEHSDNLVVEADDNDRIELARQATKTPHTSRSGFATQFCIQCNRRFKPDINQATACRWHIGIQVFTCFACGRLDYQPGCASGFHKM